LIQKYKPEKLIVFPAILQEEFRQYAKVLADLGTPDAVEDSLKLPAGTMAVEVLQLFNRIVKQSRRWKRRKKGPRPALIQPPGLHVIEMAPAPVRVRYLTPGSRLQIEYSDEVRRARDKPPGSTHPNLASGALLIEFGLTRVLLMADTETPAWDEWAADRQGNSSLDIPGIASLKVGHHGSENGYHAELYEIVDRSRPPAVMTPFDRQRNALPSRDGIERIRPHLGEVFCTNRFAAARSSGHKWEPVPGPSRLAVPASWIASCLKEPRYRGLLSPSVKGPATPETIAVPEEWRRDCLKEPELLHVLHPDVPEQRVILAKLPAGQEFRVSLYFDAHGQEIRLRRHVGRGAGRLA
jgi:hypothetical protein